MTEERNLCDLSFLKMNMLPLKLRPLLKALTSNIEIRNIALSSVLGIKEIKQVQNDKELVIYGEIQPSPREPYLLKNEDHCCPICASGLDVKHTDVLILSQFVRSDGCMLPKRITGLCKSQQKRMGSLVTMAQKAGLMPNLTPAWSKKDPKRRYRWKKFNTYFDESTIKC
ncbi:28S ribosomal protein S18a, mitochondrial [Dendroctonus ponderosae]|uniref:Large ribosomal subunit protein mL66 n=1 Tax=Dendroctonus ponderosae TaxID=77166 RepID=A0AAR5QCK2_DENPD|nr:28S ribosomal protein S18a, mitochondrial [Dendroctonus ponderosae]XP_019770953.1 28S ribosomal protein S18a, mitochondrial [Dendroctonus ponderosae]